MGTAYFLPDNSVLFTPDPKYITFWSAHKGYSKIEHKSPEVWIDPLYLAPFLKLEVIRQSFVEVIMANHVWVSSSAKGTFSCSSSHPKAIVCPAEEEVTLGPWMRPLRYPVGIVGAVTHATLHLWLQIHQSFTELTVILHTQ